VGGASRKKGGKEKSDKSGWGILTAPWKIDCNFGGENKVLPKKRTATREKGDGSVKRRKHKRGNEPMTGEGRQQQTKEKKNRAKENEQENAATSGGSRKKIAKWRGTQRKSP